MNLNPMQQLAVEHVDGPALCIAGPGSGKTATLTLRIQKLIESGIPANNILVITFTKAAALEMRSRFLMLSENGDSVNFGTFHSCFYNILRQELHLAADCLLSGTRRNMILKECAREAHLDSTQEGFLEALISELSYVTNTMTDIDGYNSSVFAPEGFRICHKKYQQEKRDNGLIDFDDMLLLTLNLFRENEAVLNKWRNKFTYFLIDEVQDMNDLQFQIIKLLCAPLNNIFAVGDDDQSIYGFRGANPSIMLSFEQEFAGCKKIILDTNYRCPNNIVSSSLNLINHNQKRFTKDIKATNPDGEIHYISCRDEQEQANFIIHDISKKVSEGQPLSSFAILFRNHSDARVLTEELLKNKLPFFLKDNMPNTYNHWIVRDLCAYLRLAVGGFDRNLFLQIMNKPNRYFSRSCLNFGSCNFDTLKTFYRDKYYMLQRVNDLQKDLNCISRMRPFAAITYIRNAIGYDQYLREYAYSSGDDFSVYINICDMITETVKSCKTIKDALNLIDELRMLLDAKNRETASDSTDKIGLFTLHGSKGLEYDTVYIICVNEGIIPSKKATEPDALEEERRMFYVGITRAKKNLTLINLKQKRTDTMYPSRFIKEMQTN